jgi:hypothetical protein
MYGIYVLMYYTGILPGSVCYVLNTKVCVMDVTGFDEYLLHDTVGASVVAQYQCLIALPSNYESMI